MEKRLGSALIMVEEPSMVPTLNLILSRHSEIIIARQGIPLRDRNISVISLILEGSTDEIGSLTGQIGRLKGIQVRSVLTKSRERNRETS